MADNLPQSLPQAYVPDDEIDLIELINTLWEGKWKIVAAVAVTSIITVGGLLALPSEFSAKTVIRPITTVEADRYRESNAQGFFSVDRGALQTLFIEQLQERRVLVDAVKSLGLIQREDFDSQAEYDFAVVEFADSVEMLPPLNVDGTERGEVRLNWSVVAEYYDEDLWLAALTQARDAAFENIRLALLDRFMTTVSVAEVKQDFKIEDLRAQMENAQADFDTQMEEFELRLQFQREDITDEMANTAADFDKKMEEFELRLAFNRDDIKMQMENVAADFDKRMEEFELRLDFDLQDVKTQISNALVDYDRKTANRLAFLREQAEIARKLGVAKNTIEAQTFATQSGVVANVQSDTPFYLRGYEAIDKEIELIESREDKKAFVSGLLELEQKQRQILQDQTLARAEQEKAYQDEYLALERKLRALEQDQTLARAEQEKAYQDEYLALERKLREIEQDQTLARASQEKAFLDNYLALKSQIRGIEQDQTIDRAKALFAQTPVATGDNFVAASMIVEGTEFDAKNSKLMILVLAAMLSGMLAAVYVLISSAMRNRQTGEPQTDS